MRNTRMAGLMALLLLCMAMAMQGQTEISISSSTFGSIEARNIGPAIMSGRISSLDALQSDPRLLYIGTASGGVWKSTNGGIKTSPVFDKHTQSIGVVCIDQEHPDTVWVGTGESWVRNSVSVGDGVYKTTDGGDRWKNMGLQKTERISRIIIHPGNPDIVYVAALGHLWGPNDERGVYKTIDGGQSWRKVLYVDENTGCSDMDIDPENPDILYAGMWQFRRKAWTFNSGGPGSGLYKSMDGGETWTELTADLPEGDKGRIAVRVSPANPSLVYTLVEAKKTALYRSLDKGSSWEMMNNSPDIRERPFYFARVFPDPMDTNRIYKMGLYLSVSEDGGRTFRGTNFAGGAVHPDFHDVWISQKNPRFMYVGTDGGVYSSNDMGSSWLHMRNLPVAQFYKISVDMQKPYHVYGGLQDNGSWSAPSRGPDVGGLFGGSNSITNYDWQSYGFGDGFSVYPDKEDPGIIYWQLQGGMFARWHKKENAMKFIAPIEDESSGELRYNWDAAIHMSPANNTIYVGAQYLYRSGDRGDTWQRISPDLTTNDPEKQKQDESGGLTIDNSTAENHCSIVCIAESALDKKLIWVGTDDGNLQVTKDGGEHWINVSGNVPGLPSNTWCSSVYPGHFDKGTAYATFDGHRNDDMSTYIFRTSDYGNTWTSIADNNINGYCYKVLEDLEDPELLFLGTEKGLFISLDRGSNWAQFKGNLPAVSVMDMVIHPRDHDLVLGTHGRGVYIIDDISTFRQLTAGVLESDFIFLDQRPAIPVSDVSMAWPVNDDEYIGRGPRSGIPITFYMKKRHIFGKMLIEVLDENGKVIANVPAATRKGINQVYWSPVIKPPRVPRTEAIPYHMLFAIQTLRYPAGEYMVRVTKGKEIYTGKANIYNNPELPYTPEEMDLRNRTAIRAYDLLEDMAYTDRMMNDVLEQTAGFTGADEIPSSLKKKITEMHAGIENIKDRMMVREFGDIRGDTELREKLGFLYGSILMYPGKPTNSQLNRLDELAVLTGNMAMEVDKLFKNQLAGINKQLEKTGRGTVKITTREEFDAEKE